MTAPTVPASRVARDLLALIPDLRDMDDAELVATGNRAARAFTGASLHRNVARLGDEVGVARDLWYAVQAEWEARR